VRLATTLEGALAFAAAFEGELATETMLVEGINDSAELIEEVADVVARLQPDTAYLAIPTRPPAEVWVQPSAEERINRAYQIFSDRVGHVEYLIGYEGNAFTCIGNVAQDLLSITAVHPMRAEAVSTFLARAGADWSVVQRLIAQEQLVETEYAGRRFYLRRLRGPKASQCAVVPAALSGGSWVCLLARSGLPATRVVLLIAHVYSMRRNLN
jgi:hypothetical protein